MGSPGRRGAGLAGAIPSWLGPDQRAPSAPCRVPRRGRRPQVRAPVSRRLVSERVTRAVRCTGQRGLGAEGAGEGLAEGGAAPRTGWRGPEAPADFQPTVAGSPALRASGVDVQGW